MISLVLALAIISLVYWFTVGSKHPEKFPPGPGFALPLLGNSIDIGTDLRRGFFRISEKYGDIFGLFIGPRRAVVISDYDLIQEIGGMLEVSGRPNLDGFGYLRGGKVDGGNGLKTVPGVLFSSGSLWADQRRFTLHTLRDLGFGKSKMEEWITDECIELCELFANSNEKPIDVGADWNVAVLKSLWIVITGEKMSYDDPKLKELVNLLNTSFKEMSRPSTIFVQNFEILAKLSHWFDILTLSKAIPSILNLAKSVVREHEDTFQDDHLRDFTDHYLAEITRRTQIGDKSSFTGSQGFKNLSNILVDFFMAGSETTANSLNFSLLYMIGYPDVQKKVQEELDTVFGKGKQASFQERLKTPYTEAVLCEIMRMSTVAPLGVFHLCSTDTFIGNGKYFIPKDSLVFMFLEKVMKDPKVFPDPHKFDPTRHLDENGKFVQHPHIIPFGVGKRRCLGENLARMTLYIFFTGILSQFDLEKANPDDYLDFEPQVGVTLIPKPYKLKFVPRK